MSDAEITELDELEATKVSGVGSPANGTKFIVLKAQHDNGVTPDPESPHVNSPEADAQEEEMTKAEADEIETLLTKQNACGAPGCGHCEEFFASLPEGVATKARLKAKERRALPKGVFAIPEKAPGPGSYPMPDKGHAESALRLAHNASPAEQSRIKAKAKRDFGVGGAQKEKVEKSPGVPDASVATPSEHGHLATGQSGLAGNMTAGTRTVTEGGETTAVIPEEIKIEDNPPAPAAKSWEIEVVEKQNWVSLDDPQPDAADATVTSTLTSAYMAVRRVMDAQRMDPDNLTDPHDAQLWAHLEDAKAALMHGLVDQAIDVECEPVQKSALDHLAALFGGGNTTTAGDGANTSEEDYMATITKEELDAHIAESAATAVKPLGKKLQKAMNKKMKKMPAKIVQAMAEKNANNGGDISAETMAGEIHGQHDANDVNAVPDGGHVDGQYVNKQVEPKQGKSKKSKGNKALIKVMAEQTDLLRKMAARPRPGGPSLDGQARGAGVFPAAEARLTEGVAKGEGESELAKLEKSFADEKDPILRMQKGEHLTLERLRHAHEEGLI